MERRIVACVALLVALVVAGPLGAQHTAVWAVLICFIAYVLATVSVTTVRRWNLTRSVRNAAVVASLTILVLWVISVVAYVRLPYAPKRAVAVGRGNFIHHTGVSIAGTPLTLTATWSPTTDVLGEWATSSASWGNGRVAYSSYIPIWPLAVAVALPTAVLWLVVPRRYPAGHCQECGYNLTGNVSGVCPECGTEVKEP